MSLQCTGGQKNLVFKTKHSYRAKNVPESIVLALSQSAHEALGLRWMSQGPAT